MVSMSIQDFVSNVAQAGLARVPLFQVIVTGPAALGMRRDLMYKVHHVNIPGKTLATGELMTYGPTRQVAVGSSFGTLDLSVFVSHDFNEKLFFQRWQALASGYGTLSSSPAAGMFDIGYYDSYVGSLTIQQLDVAGQVKYTCLVEEAYPTVVSPLTGDWSSDDVHKLGLTFAFRKFTDDTDSSTLATLFPSSSTSNPTQ